MEKFKWLLDKTEVADRTIPHNRLWDTNNKIINQALGDISGDLLRELYVKTMENPMDLDRLPALLLGISNKHLRDLFSESLSQIENESPQIEPIPGDKKLIYLIGSAGIGKSTYLKYIFDFKIPEAQNRLTNNKVTFNEILSITVDFKYASINENNIEKWVYESIKDKFLCFAEYHSQIIQKYVLPELDKYLLLYPDDSERLNEKRSMLLDAFLEDPIFHVKNVSKYVKKDLKKNLVLIFDNLDHHENEYYISKIIRFGQAILNQLDCKVVIALREENFGYTLRNLFDTLTPYNLYFSNPVFEETLNKRLFFIFQKIKKSNNSFTMDDPKYLVQEEKIFGLIKSAAGKNVRILLQLVRHIFKSGYLSLDDENNIKFIYTRAIKALIYENFKIFKPADRRTGSFIINIFENEEPNYSGNSLIRLRLLQLLENRKTWVEVSTVIRDMELLGYSKERVDKLINTFSTFADKLIERVHYTGDNKTDYTKVKISEMGRLHLKLVKELDYIDAIKSATFLPEHLYEEINKSKLFPETNSLEQREKEINHFIDFLLSKEASEYKNGTQTGNFETFLKLYKTLYKLKDDFLPRWQGQIKKIKELNET